MWTTWKRSWTSQESCPSVVPECAGERTKDSRSSWWGLESWRTSLWGVWQDVWHQTCTSRSSVHQGAHWDSEGSVEERGCVWVDDRVGDGMLARKKIQVLESPRLGQFSIPQPSYRHSNLRDPNSISSSTRGYQKTNIRWYISWKIPDNLLPGRSSAGTIKRDPAGKWEIQSDDYSERCWMGVSQLYICLPRRKEAPRASKNHLPVWQDPDPGANSLLVQVM